jgi:vWA-MoxR associated protein C-terminal domain
MPRVGSGYIVSGSTVLTANHVADGTGHRIECDDGAFTVDPAKTVLSGTNEVDLGVLQLAGSPLGLEQLPLARVGREEMIITGCAAVGFPRWTADEQDRQYESKQIEGFIRTADRVRMRQVGGGVDGQLLQLTIVWQDGDQRVPVPAGQLDEEPANPWGGMSGAVVTAPGPVVIGVVHSHNYARNPEVLTVTPLLALTRLSEPKQRQFCDALGISDIQDLPLALGQKSPGPAGAAAVDQPRLVAPTSPMPMFTDGIRDNYQRELAALGLQVPPPWSSAAFEKLYRECEQRIALQGIDPELLRARDLAKALWLAAAALPLLNHFGRQDIGIRKLQYLYHRHVHSLPDCATLDGMLIQAAGVGIKETYETANDRGQPGDETVTGLARFLLGIASHWKARQGPAALVDLTEVKSWVREHLDLQMSDIEKYLDGIRQRAWALIEFETQDMGIRIPGSAAREMPTAIIMQTVSDAGKVRTKRFECQPTSEVDVIELLRDYVNSWLPDGDFIVDFFLPRDWFDAGVADWELIQVAGSFERLSTSHDPHLRWRKHRLDGELADRLRTRFARMRWMENPEDIPPNISSDPVLLKAWLDDRNRPGTQDPPYLIGSSHGAKDHDPLASLLQEGYGFITWFTAEATALAREEAADVANVLSSAFERKDNLPLWLATRLRQHKPIIIWSEPDKREDFDMPPAKCAGPRRSDRKRT